MTSHFLETATLLSAVVIFWKFINITNPTMLTKCRQTIPSQTFSYQVIASLSRTFVYLFNRYHKMLQMQVSIRNFIDLILKKPALRKGQALRTSLILLFAENRRTPP